MNKNRFSASRVAKTLTVLSLFWPLLASALYQPLDYKPAAHQILALLQKNDILIYGEQHSLRDSRRLLMTVLKRGFDLNLIDGFSTEYVLEELETSFQKFITDDSAIPGSPAEARFFADIDATKYFWLKDDLNKDFFRFLRNEKLLHPKVVMCGLDAKSSTDKIVRQATFAKMPQILIDSMKQAFRIDLQSMVDRVNNFYDREPMMALNAVNCIAKSNRAVIHVGNNHAWSIHYDNTKYEQKSEPGWQAVSHFIHALLPNKKIVTTFTAQPFDEKADPLLDALVAANAVFHKGDLTRLSLLPTYSASPEIKSLLQMKLDSGELLPIWPVWDYLILGPKGDQAPLWSN